MIKWNQDFFIFMWFKNPHLVCWYSLWRRYKFGIHEMVRKIKKWIYKFFKMCFIWWTLRSNPFVVEVNFDVNLYISTSELPKQTSFLVASVEKAVKNYLKCIKGLKEICKVFFMQWYFELSLLIFTVKVPSSFLQNYWDSRLQVFLSKAALKKNRKVLKEKTHVPEFIFNKVAGQQNPSAQLLLNQMALLTTLYMKGLKSSWR